MKKLLAPLLILLVSFTTNVEDWKTINLLEKVTITLPGTPAEDKSTGLPMQKVVLEDSSEVGVLVLDFTKFGMNEQMLTQLAENNQLKSMLETQLSMQPGIKVLKNETGKYNNKYVSYETTLDINQGAFKGILNQRTVIYKQYGITMIYKPGKKGENEELRDKVFNSLKITE